MLKAFWHKVQLSFANSERGQEIWLEVTGKSWPTHSDTRWWSMFEVLEVLMTLMPDLHTVVGMMVKEKVSDKSACSLNVMLQAGPRLRMIELELACTVETGTILRNFTYAVERDGKNGRNPTVFEAGALIDELYMLCPLGANGRLPTKLPSTEALIKRAVKAVEGEPEVMAVRAAREAAEQAPTQTLTEVLAAVPRPQRPRRATAVA